MHFAQPLLDTIQISSIAALASVYYGLIYVPLALLAVVLCHVCHVRGWQPGPALGRWIVVGLALGGGGMLISAGLAMLNGGMTQAAVSGHTARGLLAIGMVLTLFQVLTEELLFRGWLRLALNSAFGPAFGIIVSALAYAGFVMASSGFAALPFVNLLLLGLMLGLIAQRSGGIAAPIAVHFGWALVEDFVLGLNPNPGTGTFGTLVDYDLLGSPLWGGSEAGLAASIGTSAVLIAIILPLMAARRNHTKSAT